MKEQIEKVISKWSDEAEFFMSKQQISDLAARLDKAIGLDELKVIDIIMEKGFVVNSSEGTCLFDKFPHSVYFEELNTFKEDGNYLYRPGNYMAVHLADAITQSRPLKVTPKGLTGKGEK